MSKPMFILNGSDDQIGVEYQNGLFPKIPNYHKTESWFVLTEGTEDDILVDARTTVKDIRKGQYKRLIEVSRNSLVVTHTFDSKCRETSYTFKVTIKANAYVNDPIKFCANVKSISPQEFLNNQFLLDVRGVTAKYSILNYNGIDDDLTSVLTSTVVTDTTSGLSYRVITVITEPNAEAMKILKDRDDMLIKEQMTKKAGQIASQNRDKSYADAIWEEAAKGSITDVEAIQRIEEYKKHTDIEKLDMLLRLRNEGMISNTQMSSQANGFLPYQAQNVIVNQIESHDDEIETLFDEEE